MTQATALVHEADAGRYVLLLGDRVVGQAEYRSRPDGVRVFFHTEIDPDFEGRGLASRLTVGALAATRDEGLRVIAECPYVRAFVRKHPDDYRDLVISPRL